MIGIKMGLSKSQVRAIVKIASSKSLVGRDALQGLCYHAQTKVWYVTDGYVASAWHMDDKGERTIEIKPEALPEADAIIPYPKLKAWLANAKAKDVLAWPDLKEMAEPNRSPDMLSMMGNDGPADHAYIDPARLALLLPLFEYHTDIKMVKRGQTVQALRIELVNDQDYMSPKQEGMAMGMQK